MWKKRVKAGLGAAIKLGDPVLTAFGPPRLLVLMYHRVLPVKQAVHPTIQPGMVVTAGSFERQLQWLQSSYTMLHLAEWVERANSGAPLPRRACAITLDDGWHDNYQHAFPILRRHSVPATIFVTSSRIGTRKWFWPERLARLLWNGVDIPPLQLPSAIDTGKSGFKAIGKRELNGRQIDAAIGHAKIWPDRDVEKLLDEAELSSGLGPPEERQLLTWGELREMVNSGLVEVGSHTANHIRLRFPLGNEILHHEIVNSRKEIADKLGVPLPNLFCYPNGDWSRKAEQMVRTHYSGACTTHKGINTQDTAPHRILRVGIHESVANSEHLLRYHTACSLSRS